MDGTQQLVAVHPLDPLSAEEVGAVASAVRAHDGFTGRGERTRFITIDLAEPHKDALLAWEAGGEVPPRRAEVVLLDRDRAETIEALVALAEGAVTSWHVRTDVQPMAVVSELMEA